MKITETTIPDVKIIEPKIFGDERGFFYESYNHNKFLDAIESNVHFVQDNHSRSQQGVLRGLHYQIKKSQGKLVRVVKGLVFDVAVDMRQQSDTFGQWVGCELSEHNFKQMWVPEGFAHGFIVLSEVAEFLYKTTDYYAPEHERSVIWNDKDINIKWPVDYSPILSEKDSEAVLFKDAEYFK